MYLGLLLLMREVLIQLGQTAVQGVSVQIGMSSLRLLIQCLSL